MRCIICAISFRSPPPDMRKDQICSNCKNNQKENPNYYKIKLEKQKEKHEKMLSEMEKKSLQKEARLKKQRESISHNSKKIKDHVDDKIFVECELLIKNYKNKPKINEFDMERIDDLIETYIELKSLKKISKVTGLDEKFLRQILKSPMRLPLALKRANIEGQLDSDPKISNEIALYATDHYNWDGEDDHQDEILNFAFMLAKCFRQNNYLREKIIGKTQNFERGINESTKTAKLQRLKEKYPWVASNFNKYTDRTQFQYWKLVSTKNLRLAEFVLKWEYIHKYRIPKKMAFELSTNPEKFLEVYKKELEL